MDNEDSGASAQTLIQLLSSAKASSTFSAYIPYVQEFMKFVPSIEVTGNVNFEAVVLCFLSKKYASGTRSALGTVRAALCWFFDSIGVSPNPARASTVKALVEGSKRSAPCVQHRAKVSLSDMQKIFAVISKTDCSVTDLRICNVLILMFSAYLRVSEAISLACTDVVFHPEKMDVKIKCSKTDQYGSGVILPIMRANNRLLCPVAALERWLRDKPASVPLFPSFSSNTSVFVGMSADNVRKELERLKRTYGLAPELTTHSFRGGAATEAISAGVEARAVMAAGRWKSTEAFSAYVSSNISTLGKAICSRFDDEDDSPVQDRDGS